jgi:hypothetical protein
VLTLWTGDELLSSKVSALLAVLAAGNLLNVFMHMPFQAQLCFGWTSLSLYLGAVSATATVILIYMFVPADGVYAAAIIWAVIRAIQFVVGPQFMFARIMVGNKRRWILDDIAIPVVFMAIVFAVFKVLPVSSVSVFENAAMISVCVMFSIVVGLISSNRLRPKLARIYGYN